MLRHLGGWFRVCRRLPPVEQCHDPHGFRRLEVPLARLLQRHQGTLLSELRADGLVLSPAAEKLQAWLRHEILRWLHTHQPFFEPEPEDLRRIDELHRELFERARALLAPPCDEPRLASGLAQLLDGYCSALGSCLRHLLAEAGLRPSLVVWAEYSPDCQLEVLGLELSRLPEPILDLGCGPKAGLVQHLRARGKAAVGIDRYLDVPTGVRVLDWFELPLVARSWGTVIAHQSFSLHFLHQHLRSARAAERYARRYREILEALKPGGLFAYAPGLPFVERLLPSSCYRVIRQTLPEPSSSSPWLQPLVARMGESPLYACQIRRL